MGSKVDHRMVCSTQVDRLKTVREKPILKPCLMQESHSVKALQSYFSDPFSLQSKQLQPDQKKLL